MFFLRCWQSWTPCDGRHVWNWGSRRRDFAAVHGGQQRAAGGGREKRTPPTSISRIRLSQRMAATVFRIYLSFQAYSSIGLVCMYVVARRCSRSAVVPPERSRRWSGQGNQGLSTSTFRRGLRMEMYLDFKLFANLNRSDTSGCPSHASGCPNSDEVGRIPILSCYIGVLQEYPLYVNLVWEGIRSCVLCAGRCKLVG